MAIFKPLSPFSPRVWAFGLAAAALVLAGCSGDDKKTGNIAPASDVPKTYSAVYTQVLGVTTASGCAHEDCHGGTGTPTMGGPNFTDKAALYTALTTKTMSQLNWVEHGENCGSFKLAVPGDATKSLLVGTVVPEGDASAVFVKGTCVPAISNHVTPINATVTGNKAKGLVEWIKAGAKNN